MVDITDTAHIKFSNPEAAVIKPAAKETKPAETTESRFDINGDGKVNWDDLTELIRIVKNGG